MKNGLKNFIDKNRDAFDDREPSEKVWQGIASALPGMKQGSLWNSVAVWRAAAVLFLGLSFYFFMTRTTAPSRREIASAQIEFADIEYFYNNQIAEKVALINDLDTHEAGDALTQDFQKLDAMYQVLLEEMRTRPSEKVKDAMVLNWLVRIDLLNQQIKKLEDSRKLPKKPDASVV